MAHECNHCPINTDEFKEKMLTGISALQADMKSILGNGQPGRLGLVEKDVKELSTNQQRIFGALVLVSVVIPIVLHFWK